MRYADNRKEETRRQLLEQGAIVLKKAGFAATGVDQLMKAVGLTGGALYAHFPSKMDLLVAIVQREMQRSVRMLTGTAEEPAAAALERCLDTYLTLDHVRQPERGCILPALAAELGRASPEVKQVIDEAEQTFLDFWADKLGDRGAALVLINQCVGAILLARMTDDEDRQREILEASRRFLRTALLAQ